MSGIVSPNLNLLQHDERLKDVFLHLKKLKQYIILVQQIFE